MKTLQEWLNSRAKNHLVVAYKDGHARAANRSDLDPITVMELDHLDAGYCPICGDPLTIEMAEDGTLQAAECWTCGVDWTNEL